MSTDSLSIFHLFNPVYFWDSNLSKLDAEKDADYIIRRVFELGEIEEIGYVHGWYGLEKCQNALLNAESLRESAIVQGMVFLDIADKNLFKASHQKQHFML